MRDLYETGVEIEAVDDSGKAIFHSGYIKPDGMLDETAHVYKAILLDDSARVITLQKAVNPNESFPILANLWIRRFSQSPC